MAEQKTEHLHVTVTPAFKAGLQRTAEQRETTVSEVVRTTLRREIQKDFPITNRTMPRSKEDSNE